MAGTRWHRFQVQVRDNKLALLDFSVILLFIDSDGSQYILLRYNGKHPSEHTNKWEKRRKLPNANLRNVFHIHRATERYQVEPGCLIDGYAEATQEYCSFDTALSALVRSNGFKVEPDVAKGQLSLPFESGET